MPTPLRTPQTSGHFSSRVSNLPLRSLKPPSSHGSKIIIFHLSQSKCTVFAHRRESRVFPCIVCILCIVSVFSYPRDTPFKKGRRTKHCAAALKVEIVLLEKALTCPASRGRSCRWWLRPDRTSSADPMRGRSSRTRPARPRGAREWAASHSERRRRLRPDRR